MKKTTILAALVSLIGCTTTSTVPANRTAVEPTPCETAVQLVAEVQSSTANTDLATEEKLEFCRMVDDGDGDFAFGIVRERYRGENNEVLEGEFAISLRKTDTGWQIAGAKPLYVNAPIPGATTPPVLNKPAQPAPDTAHDVNLDKKTL